MNRILLRESELHTDRTAATLRGRALLHVRTVLRAQVGDTIAVGVSGGPVGTARILALDDERAELEVVLDGTAPAPLPLTLVLALPRPKVLARVLRSAIGLGVDAVHVIHSYRVEKAYWSSPKLKDAALAAVVHDALELAGTTIAPSVELHRFFKPFAEDRLPELVRGRCGWLMHPRAEAVLPGGTLALPALVAIGPEGGFLPYEDEQLAAAGLRPARFGPRILGVETAVPALLARFLPMEGTDATA